MMNRIGMIYIFWTLSMELKSCSHALTNKSVCVTDYWATISCSLKLPVTSFENTSYWLQFQKISGSKKNLGEFCPLQTTREVHICRLKGPFRDMHKYNVTLIYIEMGNSTISVLDPEFIPAKNIKPTAPFNLTLEYENETYHFFWKSGYETHVYKTALLLKYEFLLYKDGDHKNVSVYAYTEMVTIQFDLDPGSPFLAMVRTSIQESNKYGGTWSDWSSTVKWTTAHRDESKPADKIVIVMFLMIGLLIVLMLIPAARFKMREIAWVPTPATYFQPLYQMYQGSFQGWVLPKRPLQDIHVLEDFSTIDKISEVIYTFQDQAEKTIMYPPAQSHPPYVGPSTEFWPPRQMPDMCIETSVPFEDFPLFCEDLPGKVDELMLSVSVACLSEDVQSLKDSVVSLESLDDCEFTEVPAIINPITVCFKQDYCTLTDTSSGPVPTFSREADLDENTSGD